MAAVRAAPVVLAGTGVAAAYAVTAARTVTRWDSGEFLAAIHSLGIPHPPGTALYVLLARAWTLLPLPGTFAFRVSLFSAFCAAGAVTVLGLLVAGWMRSALAGVCAVLCAGGTMSLWLTATEAEVYAPALLLAIGVLAVGAAERIPIARRLMLVGYGLGLGLALHPASLVTAPAVALLVVQRSGGWSRARLRLSPGPVAAWVGAFLLGVSAVLFLLLRAQHDPAINQGDPSTIPALWDVLTRAQYAPAGPWPRRAPLWLQFGNWFEYADWQFGYGLAPGVEPSWVRTPVTIAFAFLGAVGLKAHRRTDRQSWAVLLVAFLSATVLLTLYLNLRLGPSFGHGLVPVDAVREARERDYFFIPSFVIWGAWAGVGAVAVAAWLRAPVRQRGLALSAALAVAAIPLPLNFGAAHRARFQAAERTRAMARGILNAMPARAVLLALGDNDTYPLWYAQEVERVRRDVTVVTVPLLAAAWYRHELARRHDLLDAAAVGTSAAVREVCRRARTHQRPVVLTPFGNPATLTAECDGLVQMVDPVETN